MGSRWVNTKMDKGKISMINYLKIELPIDSMDAKSRSIDLKLCRLFIGYDDTNENKYLSLGKIIENFCGNGKSIFISSYGEYYSLEKIRPRLDEEEIQILSKFNVIKCSNVSGVEKVLKYWSAEELVIFCQEDEIGYKVYKTLSKLEKKWWQVSNESYEGPFLRQIENCDPLICYSQTHDNLEIFGTYDTILKGFENLLKFEEFKPNVIRVS